jgi:hypothetical protein
MAKVFSVASWNIEHFKDDPTNVRIDRVVEFVKMGLEYPFDRNIEAAVELKKWDKYGTRAKIQMTRLAKTHDATWFNGSRSSLPPSNLDHVFASTNVKFKKFVRPIDGAPARVSVRGWVDQPTLAAQDDWIKKFSDHSMMFFEIVT